MIVVDEGYLEYDRAIENGEESPELHFKPLILINPEIVEHDGTFESEEGCLSVPGYRAVVARYLTIKVTYMDMDGKKQEISGSNLTASCLQHEIDHLEGTLFIDKLSRLKKRIALKKVNNFVKDLKEKEEDEIENYLYG